MDSIRGVNLVLAQFKNIGDWQPKITDFIIWHGWFWGRWYGIVNGINDGKVIIVKEGLPSLLLMLPENAYSEHSIEVPVSKICCSSRGEYHILQEGVWFI